METLFQTQRSQVVKAYKDAAQPFVASTKPYKSTTTFNFFMVNSFGASGLLAGSAGILLARAGQRVEWFSYPLGSPVPGSQVAFTVRSGERRTQKSCSGVRGSTEPPFSPRARCSY